MNKNLEQLTKIIQEAVPEIQCRNTSMMLKGVFTGLINHRDDTITLADVLRAIGFEYSDSLCDADILGSDGVELYTLLNKWDLSKPLHLQSQETIDFLLSILTQE